MNIESPTLGESAGLEVRKSETKASISTTTGFGSLQFQPDLTVSQPALDGEPVEHELFDGNPLQADAIDEGYQAELAHREEVAKRQVARGQTMSLRLNLRLAELQRFARHRIEQGDGLDLTEWLVSVAVTLKAREGWAWTKTKSGRKVKRFRPVMGLPSLWEQAYRAGINLPDSVLKPIDEQVSGERSRQWLEPCEQGERLHLTVEERTVLTIKTIEAEGETPSERRARVERARSQRRNARRREERIAAGKTPRDGSRTREIKRLAAQFGRSEHTIRRMIREGRLDVSAYGTAQNREEIDSDPDNPLSGATSGQSHCRAVEPEPTLPVDPSALARLRHVGLSSDQSPEPSAEPLPEPSPLACDGGRWLSSEMGPPSDIEDLIERHPSAVLSRILAERLRKAHDRLGYTLRKQRKAEKLARQAA